MAYEYDRRQGAAKPVPSFVAAGKELAKIASEYESLAKEFAALESAVPNLVSRIVALKTTASGEHELETSINRLLHSLTQVFVSSHSLKADAAKVSRAAGELKTSIR